MKAYSHPLQTFAVSTLLVSLPMVMNAHAEESVTKESATKLLTVNFEPRQVVKIEAGDFHFTPGQIGPIHIHVAPTVGYVAKGEILYQVEGEKPHLLREGDVFNEPNGPRILRFDNASATEEAIFVDFNLQQEGESFIVFEKELTMFIDRRMLLTVTLDGQSIDRTDIFAIELAPNGHKKVTTQTPLVGYVAEGIIILKVNNEAPRRIIAGGSFSLAGDTLRALIKNDSDEVRAKVITFSLSGASDL